jgi:glutathione S-transferase
MSELVLYHSVASRAVILLWLLEELAIPFQIVDADIRSGKCKKSEFLVINPMGKVPVLPDGTTVVTEVSAIDLADKFAIGRLAPEIMDPRRGASLRWSVFASSVLDPTVNLSPSSDPKSAYDLGWGNFDAVVAAMEQALTPGPYLLTDWFTAADVIFGGMLSFGMFNKKLPERAIFSDYYRRLNARDAWKRAADRTWPPELFDR